MTPEFRFVASAASGGPLAPTSGLGWEQVLSIAAWHRLGPMLFGRLGTDGTASIPSAIRDRLEADYLETAARTMYRTVEVARAVEALGAVGIELMLLKGAALVATVYADAATRPMVDVDILVREADLHRADETIRGLGYSPQVAVEGRMGEKLRRGAAHQLAGLVSADRLVVFEIHRHIFADAKAGRFDIGRLWDRAEASASGALLPCPEHLLLHVAEHFMYNRFNRSEGALGQLADIAAVVTAQGHELDWDLVVGEAMEAGAGLSLYLALVAARDTLGLAAPADVLARLRPAGFDDRMARSFVDRRVVNSQPWLSLELLQPGKNPVRRLFPSRQSVTTRFGPGEAGARSMVRLYGVRAGGAARLVASGARQPRQAVADMLLNRRLRALASSAARRPGEHADGGGA